MPPLTIETEPDPKDLQFLEDRIIEFNYQATGYTDGKLLAIFDRDAQGAITAGVSGFTWGGVCQVDWLWVRQDLRTQGTGRRLMEAVEAEAVRRGCRKIVLSSHSFQAPGFYIRLGFTIMGQYEDYPLGFQSVYLEKRLA